MIPMLYEQVKTEEISFPAKAVSEDLKDLITQMLNKDPETRINMQQIKVRNQAFFLNFPDKSFNEI